MRKLLDSFPWRRRRRGKTKGSPARPADEDDAMEAPEERDASDISLDLVPCAICNRTFLPASLLKHSRVCERNLRRKRKVFDSSKQRIEGTDLAQFHQKSYLKRKPPDEPKRLVNNWKQKHMELVEAIRAAKGTTATAQPNSLPPSKRRTSSLALGNPPNTRCPSCDRHFGPKAYDRHVEWCKERRTTIHKSPASVQIAKERLEMRTKYKVPPLTRSKRLTIKEKYATVASPSRVANVDGLKSASACVLDRKAVQGGSKRDANENGVSEEFKQEDVKQATSERVIVAAARPDNRGGTERRTNDVLKSTLKRPPQLPWSTKLNGIDVNNLVEGLNVAPLTPKRPPKIPNKELRQSASLNLNLNVLDDDKLMVKETSSDTVFGVHSSSNGHHLRHHNDVKLYSNSKLPVLVNVTKKVMVQAGPRLSHSPKRRSPLELSPKKRISSPIVIQVKPKDDELVKVEEDEFDSKYYEEKLRSMKESLDDVDVDMQKDPCEDFLEKNRLLSADLVIKIEDLESESKISRISSKRINSNSNPISSRINENISKIKSTLEFLEDTKENAKMEFGCQTDLEKPNFWGNREEEIRTVLIEKDLCCTNRNNVVFEQGDFVFDPASLNADFRKFERNVRYLRNRKENVNVLTSKDSPNLRLIERKAASARKYEEPRRTPKRRPRSQIQTDQIETQIEADSNPSSTRKEMVEKKSFEYKLMDEVKTGKEEGFKSCLEERAKKFFRNLKRAELNAKELEENIKRMEMSEEEEAKNRVIQINIVEKNKVTPQEKLDNASEESSDVSEKESKSLRRVRKEKPKKIKSDKVGASMDENSTFIKNPNLKENKRIKMRILRNSELKSKSEVVESKTNRSDFIDKKQLKKANNSDDEDTCKYYKFGGGRNKSRKLLPRSFNEVRNKQNDISHRKRFNDLQIINKNHFSFNDPQVIHKNYKYFDTEYVVIDPITVPQNFMHINDYCLNDEDSKFEETYETLQSPSFENVEESNDDRNYSESQMITNNLKNRSFQVLTMETVHVFDAGQNYESQIEDAYRKNAEKIREKLEEIEVKRYDLEHPVKVNSYAQTDSDLEKSDEYFYWRKPASFSENDSVVDGCEDDHSHALSFSRIERQLRNCCSDCCLKKNSDVSSDLDVPDQHSSYENIQTPQGGNEKLIPIDPDKSSTEIILDIPSKRRKIDVTKTDLVNNITKIKEMSVENDLRQKILTTENILSETMTEGIETLELKQVLSTIQEVFSDISSNSHKDKSKEALDANSIVTPRFVEIVKRIVNSSGDDEFVTLTKRHCKKMLLVDQKGLMSALGDLKQVVRLPEIISLKPRFVQRVLPPLEPREEFTLPALQNKGVFEPLKTPSDICADAKRSNYRKIVSKSDNFDIFASAEKQFMDLLESDDFKPFTPTTPTPIKKPKHQQQPSDNKTSSVSSPIPAKRTLNSKQPTTTINNTKKQPNNNHNNNQNNNNKRASVIDPPDDFRDRLTTLNDDFDLIENLINESFAKTATYRKNEINKIDFEFASKYSDESGPIDPRLINETDNLAIPESFNEIDESSPTSSSALNCLDGYSEGTEIKLKQSVSLLDDEYLEGKQLDEVLIALKSPDATRKVSKLPKSHSKSKGASSSISSAGDATSKKDDRKRNLSSLKRSTSILDPVQKPKQLMKSKQDVQNYFKGNSSAKVLEPIKVDQPKVVTDELFSIDDEMYEEYKRYEEMYLREKEELLRKEEQTQASFNTGSEDDDNRGSKVSADSAYGSLTRRTPKARARSTKLTPLESHAAAAPDSPTSSGSELSPVPANPPSTPKMSKFCHECGNRYPLAAAKFCVECGIKRLVL